MLYIIGGIILALTLGFIANYFQKNKTANTEPDNRPDDCCGAHEVCESDSLLSSNDQIEYYEDEELDQYKNMSPNLYSDIQIEEFREVLYTLKEREVAGWLKSLNSRQVIPPGIIREEALMIVAERRGL